MRIETKLGPLSLLLASSQTTSTLDSGLQNSVSYHMSHFLCDSQFLCTSFSIQIPLLPPFAWSVLAHLADPPTPNEKNLLIHAVIVLLSFNLIRTAVSHFVHIIICLMSLFPPLDFFFLLLGHGLAEACGIFSLQHKGSLVAPRGI